MNPFEAPNALPAGLEHLSHTSVDLFLRCPEKWRRRYIDREYEPAGGYQVVGRAVHAAEAQNYHQLIETGEAFTVEQVCDEFTTQLENEQAAESAIDWDGEDPGKMKDRGVALVSNYQNVIVPSMRPTKVENEFNIKLHPDHEWTIKGYIDVIAEWDDGFLRKPSGPHDIKTVKKAHDYSDSIQASLYAYATMQEEAETQTFSVHELKVLKDGPHADVREVKRDREAQMRHLQRIALVAREIAYRVQSGNWQGAAPGSWYCTQKYCGYWNDCPLVAR